MIFFDFNCNLTAEQTLARLQTVFGDRVPCKTTICHWFTEFKRDRVNLSDEFRSDCPSTALNNKNIDTVRCMIETDRYLIYHGIRALLGIGMSQIQSILHKHLAMKKLRSWWIPYNMIEAHKTDRVTWCNAMLIRFKEGMSNLV
ncbi:Histone-lysine N-methyltransferase SETMAR [Eumeta japonica]|uniref:Histone-lysine N-methyltransferase SETMAR n=1 Tax=Eumeta variegata TaxID=151549 RepID=A0A4C1Z9P6_EUMVA|nr:Histone-lysine N-methyltransferase SETMAR [Eumeta japonica]